ncbi:hypothetical protein Tco_0374931 [Tanacetum coccineum]
MVTALFTRVAKTFDLPRSTPNTKTTVILDDSEDEANKAEKEVEPGRIGELLNDSKPFLGTSKKINESSLDEEFEEFMTVDVEEILEQEEEVEDNF